MNHDNLTSASEHSYQVDWLGTWRMCSSLPSCVRLRWETQATEECIRDGNAGTAEAVFFDIFLVRLWIETMVHNNNFELNLFVYLDNNAALFIYVSVPADDSLISSSLLSPSIIISDLSPVKRVQVFHEELLLIAECYAEVFLAETTYIRRSSRPY
ncbi:uncharacterized protein G6M90_00g054360 [Metarhizium brunneum]|uniref:Uncharacterized protein n=1 Tax=Metarhizium brunneum TaxID=500148 RepID=A0A7D5Z4I8_9HYPO